MANDMKISFSGPLHEQIEDILRSRIASGEWAQSRALPGEADLSRQFGVSIGTVRKAMDSLARDNVLVRERGRGTFIKQSDDWRSRSTFRIVAPSNSPVRIEILLTEVKASPATQAEMVDLRLRTRAGLVTRVVRFSREWRAASLLVCRETVVVEESRFPGLESAARCANDTLFGVYAEKYRTKVDLLRWRIGSANPDTAATRSGEQDLQPPVLVVHRIALDARGMPIELCRQDVSLANRQVEIMR